MTTKKILEKELAKVDQRRHDIIRELDSLHQKKEHYTQLLKSPKLMKMSKIEIQKQIRQATL